MKFGEDKHSLINIRQMHYLVALAEHGSISAAASALHMAQPSMSENIARLERSLGIPLATRGSRGVRMTEAGELLARRSAEILKSIDDAIVEVHDLFSVPRGTVTVGIPPGLSLLLSVPLLETIYAEYPDIRLSITEGLSGDVLDWVEQERIDLGFVYDAFESATFRLEPLVTEEVFLITAPDNWEGRIGADGVALDKVSLQRLAELPLVMTSSRGAHALQQKVAHAAGIQLNVIATLNSLPQIVEMVSRASAYAILPHGSVHRQVAQKRLALVPIEGAVPLRRTAYLVRKKSRTASLAVSVVEQHSRKIIREIVLRYGIRGALPELCEDLPEPAE